MSDPWDGPSESDRVTAGVSPTSGPSLSYAFNLGKIPDQGEDSDPILRDGPDLGLIGVFDGMGGAGGTVYETDDGPRTGAYLASRIARDVVERRMVDLLEPDWNLNGEAAADDLRRSVKRALEERLVELKAPTSRLRSKLLRALPTTMAAIALQRTHRGGSAWTGHVFWAGDSRAYVFTADGAQQLSTDDLRDPGDAWQNLRRDSVVSNAMSADTEFHVSYRRVTLTAPYFVMCATDGCYGYLPTPMHFEHLVLKALDQARTVEAWSAAVQGEVSAITGDDAAMAVMGVGTDLKALQALMAPRLAALEADFIDPIDQLSKATYEAEQALTAARKRQEDETAALWARYQSGYERYLHPELAEPDEASSQETAPEVRTVVDGEADGVEERPDTVAAESVDPAPEEVTS